MGLKTKREKTRPWCTCLPRFDLTGVESLVTVYIGKWEAPEVKLNATPAPPVCVFLTSYHIMEMK
jgi:hypothetical protein